MSRFARIAALLSVLRLCACSEPRFTTVGDGTRGEHLPTRLIVHPGTGDIIVSANAHSNGEIYVGGGYWGMPNPASSSTTMSLAADTGSPNWVTTIDPSFATRGEGAAVTPTGDVVVALHATAPLPEFPRIQATPAML